MVLEEMDPVLSGFQGKPDATCVAKLVLCKPDLGKQTILKFIDKHFFVSDSGDGFHFYVWGNRFRTYSILVPVAGHPRTLMFVWPATWCIHPRTKETLLNRGERART